MKWVKPLVGIFLVLVMLGMVVSAVIIPKQSDIPLKPPEKLTEGELQMIYKKYGITENDIKFAKGVLPSYLKGTILNGSKRVIVTENGKVPENIAKKLKGKGIDYIVISYEEMNKIIENARKRYIKKYGVDPANPRVEVVDGVVLPKEYVKILVEHRLLKLEQPTYTTTVSSCGNPSNGPHAIDGQIEVHVFVAKDGKHVPTEPFESDTKNALERFENFNVNVQVTFYYGFWNASDVSDWDDAGKLLDDLAKDTSWVIDSKNDIVIGWVNYANHNGVAYPDGMWDLNNDGTPDFAPYALCAVEASTPDWPHDSIVQHEASHLFGADDQGYWWWEHPPCIMNYGWAYLGVDCWCDDCGSCVASNINP